MQVREIMTAGVATAAPDTTLEEIATIMRDEDTGAIPVLDDGELVGMVTDRDIVIRCLAEGKDANEMTADQILSDRLETVEPDADVQEASRLMSAKQIRRLPVVENGRLLGMLSLGDIAVKAGEQPAGEALQEVSRGVKRSPPPAGAAEERRGRGGPVRRQSKAVPIRNQGKTTRRRKAS